MANELRGPRRSNCLVWALARLWRRGGYIAVRRSRFCRLLPHVLWSRDLRTWWSYKPVNPLRGVKAFIGAALFRGRVELGD